MYSGHTVECFCCVAETSITFQSPFEVRIDKRRKERMNVFRESSDCVQSVVCVCRDKAKNLINYSKYFGGNNGE